MAEIQPKKISLRRRRLMTSLVTIPAATSLAAQTAIPPPGAPAGGGGFRMGGPVEMPVLNPVAPDAVGEATLHFFSAPQFAALRKLGSLVMPAMNGLAGAVEAQAPEFLDFLLGESGAERKRLYRAGLDRLNSQASQKFKKTFADLTDAEAGTLLAPLKTPWASKVTDPFEKFLRAAKADLRQATLNSREHATGSAGNRRFGSSGLYWHPLD